MRKAKWFPSVKTKRRAEKINSEADTDYTDVDLEIDPTLISISDCVIGDGHFGNIYRGDCQGIGPVAIEVFPSSDMKQRKEFLRVTTLWKEINHPNIVKLLGVCSHGPMYIISELMEKGNLLKNIVDNKPSMLELVNIAIQVSRGMNYLASQDFVLRYLTVRNVFISGDWNVKMGSLWMCRKLVDGVYIEKDGWPYSAVSPEATREGRFSTKSDVWSFGMLLVDMVKGWFGFFGADTDETVATVYVTPKGENVPLGVQRIISNCWKEKPDDRPSFVEIEKKLQDVLEEELYRQVDDAIYNEAYYRALEKGEAVNNRIPIMLVGQDRTGKTSLKKHLLGLPFDDQEPSTNGIEVDMVELTDENAEEPWKRKEVAQFIISEEEATEQVLKQAARLLTQREVEPEKKQECAGPFLQSQATKQDPPSSGNVQELSQGDNSTLPTSQESTIETIPKALVDDIKYFEKKVGMDETPPVRAIVHDFAGQNVFHDTHYHFLKLQCPYIVVHDLRNPLLDPAQPRFKPMGIDVERNLNNPLLATNLDNFLSWLTVLDTLRDSTGKIILEKISNFKLPPVLIALTNSDRFEGDIDEVKQKIKDILTERGFENVFIEPYVINNASSGFTKDDVRKLRRKLYELCKTILGKQRPVPVRWLQFEASLSKKMVEEKIPYISVEESRKIGEDCKVEDVDAALTFLHHQGVVVHHPGSSVVVLNPVWLMNLFTQVISLPREDNPNDARYKKLMKKGILMQEYLREREHGELLEEMMLQFGLICRWQHEECPAFIIPSVAPVMENGEGVEEQLSSSPIAPLFFHLKRGFMLPGIFTRFLVRVIEKLREFLRRQLPNLYCNYTLLSLQLPEGKCDVYVIEQLAGIKIGVVPRCAVNQRECRKIAVYLKQVMTECIDGIKEDNELYYRDIDVSLDVKCSACFGETGQCLRHGIENCIRDDCGHFWPLDDLFGCTEDPVCNIVGVVGTREFPLERVKPWMTLEPREQWKWEKKSEVHREKFEKFLKFAKHNPKEIKEVNGVRVCPDPQFCIGTGADGTCVYIGLSKDGYERAVKCLNKATCANTGVNEKKILNALNTVDSKFTVRYWSYDDQSDRQFSYLVLDLCEETLEEYVKRKSQDELADSAPSILHQMLEGLNDLHREPEPVLHRDIKPSNIMRDTNGKWMLADFGLSRTLSTGETSHRSGERGTRYWRAVESYPPKDDPNNKEVRYKRQSDIQVAGMVGFYILTNREHPFGCDGDQRVKNLRDGKPVNLTSKAAKLRDPVARDLISWMVEHRPEDRPYADQALKHPYLQSIDQQAELLKAVGNQSEIKGSKTISSKVADEINNDPLLSSTSWQGQIPPDVLTYLCYDSEKRRTFTYGPEWTECLRLIRNAAAHWNQRAHPAPAEHYVVEEPGKYFVKLFPCLLVVVHKVIRKDAVWKKRAELEGFF